MKVPYKKALLDTDFIFKANLAHNRKHQSLIERVSNFDGYEFYCHEKIIEELSYHGFQPDPLPWLKSKIECGDIRCLNDNDILDEIENELHHNAVQSFFDMLKTSCDATSVSFFDYYYAKLIALPDNVDHNTFIAALKVCEEAIQNGNSIGEKKTFVLAQLLQMKYPGRVVVFCSDDSRARQNIAYIDSRFRCLSIPSVFQKLRNDGVEKSEAEEYFGSLFNFYNSHGQKTVKVWKKGPSERISISLEEMFEGIYSDKFEIKGTGDLRYKE